MWQLTGKSETLRLDGKLHAQISYKIFYDHLLLLVTHWKLLQHDPEKQWSCPIFKDVPQQ